MEADLNNITSLETYNTEMQKALADKVFFMDVLDDTDTLIDFGCADGSLLKVVRSQKPGLKLVGIDMNKDMIDIARADIPDGKFFIDTLPVIDKSIDTKNAAINLSSVLHEVYSYCTSQQIESFWDSLNNTGCKYIIIRDMLCNVHDSKSNPEAEAKIRAKAEYAGPLQDFEEVWGSIEDKRKLIHFLLKYRYRLNWDREVRENYLPLDETLLLSKLDLNKYEIVSKELFVLPFIGKNVKDTFDIDLKDTTHIKLILKRKN